MTWPLSAAAMPESDGHGNCWVELPPVQRAAAAWTCRGTIGAGAEGGQGREAEREATGRVGGVGGVSRERNGAV